MMLLALGACVENGLAERKLDSLAVVLGDFDDVGTPLSRLGIGVSEYDGFVVQATYEPEESRTVRGDIGQSFEQLLTRADDVGRKEIQLYQAVFINSGARGLNAWRYDDLFTPDDEVLQNPDTLDTLCAFVDSGDTLVLSDWAYDVVEQCWPDAVKFVGDDDNDIDAAQTGQASSAVLATVTNKELADLLGVTQFSLAYDFTNWAVIEDVGAGTEVLLRGDVSYQPSSGELYTTLVDVPLLVRFEHNKGQVVFSTFHWAAQPAGLTDSLLLGSVDGLSAVSKEGG